MTKEEIEQRAAERFPYMSNDIPERVRTLSLRQAYITGYQQASGEVERKWIDCNERMPEKGKSYLCFTGGLKTVLYHDYEIEDKWHSKTGDVWMTAVTHWMDLPKDPTTYLEPNQPLR